MIRSGSWLSDDRYDQRLDRGLCNLETMNVMQWRSEFGGLQISDDYALVLSSKLQRMARDRAQGTTMKCNLLSLSGVFDPLIRQPPEAALLAEFGETVSAAGNQNWLIMILDCTAAAVHELCTNAQLC